jgi:hypothetical protein
VETVTAMALDAHGLGAGLDDFDELVEADAECDADFEAECDAELEEWLVEVALDECGDVEACEAAGGFEVEVPAVDVPPPPPIALITHHRMSSTASTTSSATSRRTQ